jgi:hypothetical protein
MWFSSTFTSNYERIRRELLMRTGQIRYEFSVNLTWTHCVLSLIVPNNRSRTSWRYLHDGFPVSVLLFEYTSVTASSKTNLDGPIVTFEGAYVIILYGCTTTVRWSQSGPTLCTVYMRAFPANSFNVESFILQSSFSNGWSPSTLILHAHHETSLSGSRYNSLNFTDSPNNRNES